MRKEKSRRNRANDIDVPRIGLRLRANPDLGPAPLSGYLLRRLRADGSWAR
jgi:hypothetical protein